MKQYVYVYNTNVSMVKLRYLEHTSIMIKNNRQYRHTDIFIAQCFLVIKVNQIVMDS